MRFKPTVALAGLTLLVLSVPRSAEAAHGEIDALASQLKSQAFAMSEELRCNWTRVPQFGALLSYTRTIYRLAGEVSYHSGYGHKAHHVYKDLEQMEHRLRDMHRRLNELDYWLMDRHKHGHHDHGYGAYDTKRLHSLVSAMKYTLHDLKEYVHHSSSHHPRGRGDAHGYGYGGQPRVYYQKPGYHYGLQGLSLYGPRGFGLRIGW